MPELRYGHVWSDVPAVRAAWGARWIFPNDQVHDRTDYCGSDEDWQELKRWLIDVVAAQPFDKARELASVMRYDGDVPYVLYEDEVGKFVGHPHGNSGYLYVVAWLKAHEITASAFGVGEPSPVIEGRDERTWKGDG